MDPPTIRLVALETDGAVIGWEPDTEDLALIAGFELRWSPATSGVDMMPVSLASDERSYKIRGTAANTRYEIELTAIYTNGYRTATQIQMQFDVPRTPVMRLEVVSETQVKVAWDAAIIDDGVIQRPISQYEISWNLKDSSEAAETKLLESNVNALTVDSLEPGSTYTFALRAGNGFGFGEAVMGSIQTPGPSATATPTSTATPSPTPTPTPTPTPDTRPLRARFADLRESDAVVSWQVNDESTDSVDRFELSWSPSTVASLTMPVVLMSTTREYRIKGVIAEIRYAITLEMIMTDGHRLSDQFELLLDAPRPPKARVTAMSDTNLRLSWIEPDDGSNVAQRPVTTYEISWQIVGDNSDLSFVALDAQEDSFELQGLVPGATYQVAIRALNTFGSSDATILTYQVPLPNATTTVTPTAKPSATATADDPRASTPEPRVRRSRVRVGDPEPPADLHAVQGRDAVHVYWDHPDYDGGTEVLAYAVDWMPESPPFPIFVSSDDESLGVYGLCAGTKYQVRVKAFNRIDDSMAAAQRVAMDHSLIRFRDYDPFTGSVANGRSTELRNDAELPGFELHTDAFSLFWGDHMTIEVRRLDRGALMEGYEDGIGWLLASDVFSVKPNVDSRRRRFDDSAESYELVEPFRVCIATIDAPTNLDRIYSIAHIAEDGSFYVFDSTTYNEGGQFKTCARLRTIDLTRETRYAVVGIGDEETPDQSNPPLTERQTATNNSVVLLLLVFGNAFLLFGIRLTTRDRNAER